MKRFAVKATLREMRRHTAKMGQPRVWCDQCSADTSLRWERVAEPTG